MSSNIFSFSPLRGLVSATRSACRLKSSSSKGTHSALQSLMTSSSREQSAITRRNRETLQNRSQIMGDYRAQAENRAISKFQTRDWKSGDVYAPHDLSPTEMKKWSKRKAPTKDIFDAQGLNPLDHYKNFSVMSSYMTPMGRIRHRTSTGLRGVNQRKMAKAIRRAIGIGLMPSVHRHPEIIAGVIGPGAFDGY
ncbi:ribosomal protein S18 [Aspergillus karnatakaensis]|uniref:mitochondrial 37S ribosomal protein bS18m n=1 Tax=Aspergillus karnatakaensis TaxID=1810916 RepID=UPI003CCE14EE